MQQSTKNWLAFGASMLFIILLGLTAISSAHAGGYHVTKNYYDIDHNYTVNNVTNYSGVSSKDLATVAALAGAGGQHHFTRGVKRWQGSFAGACYDSGADDCGLSLAVGKRVKDVLIAGSVSGASDDRLYSFSVGWTW